MRTFYKYYLQSGKGNEFIPRGKALESFLLAMGGYDPDDSYNDKESFFTKWFGGKYTYYDSFLRKFILKEDRILSIASGRCINELKLINDGYNIDCSDLDIPECYASSKRLFGDFNFIKMNILQQFTACRYDKIMSIGLVYSFNIDELNIFLRNISSLLKNDGILILELSVAPDNFLSFLFHDIYLRIESKFIQVFAPVSGKSFKRTIMIGGYKYKTSEIKELINNNHFELIDFLACVPLVEFQRSAILSKLIDKSNFARFFFAGAGRYMPYSRLFALKKLFYH